MRVAEIARLTGTTVRYYHSLGLLPVPAERGGWRDYDLSHLARLSRIRWLVQAGPAGGRGQGPGTFRQRSRRLPLPRSSHHQGSAPGCGCGRD